MTDVLLKILLFVIVIPLFGWLLISPLVFIWWFLNTETRDRFTEQHEKIAMAVYIGSFFSLIFVLGHGIEQLLVFIPADWGRYDEEGEFLTTKRSIANVLAFLLSVFFVHVFDKFGKLLTENERLSIIAEIHKRKDGLRYRSRETLIEKRNDTETELQKLRDRWHEGRLSSEAEKELRILKELLDEIDYRIREIEPSDALDDE